MIKKLFTYITFFTILICVYIIFSIIYFRKMETGVTVFYTILSAFVFCINLITARTVKWGIVLLMCILFSILVFMGIGGIADNPIDFIFIDGSPGTMPFLPQYLWQDINIENYTLRFIVLYLIYFWGALVYWYIIYQISKRMLSYLYKKSI